MIRLIILAVILLALYPYIGEGLSEFAKDFDLDHFYDGVENISEFVKTTWDKLKG